MPKEVNENPQPVSENAEQTPQSAEQTPTVVAPVEQQNEKDPVPYDRFKAVNARATAAEALNKKYVDEAQAKTDEELSYKERYEKEVEKGKTRDALQVQEEIDGQIRGKLIEKGLSEIITNNIAIPSDTKEDKIDEVVGGILKTLKDFIAPKTSVSLSASQPAAKGLQNVEMDPAEAAVKCVMHNNPPKK